MRSAEPGDGSQQVIPLSLDGTEMLSVDGSERALGWAAYFSPSVADAGARVLVRIANGATHVPDPESTIDPVLEVRELRVISKAGVTGFASSLLREIPILKIEAAINQTAHRTHLASLVRDAADDAEDPIDGPALRVPPSVRFGGPRRSLTIKDPGGYRKPDSFYRGVADLYLHQAALSTRPAHDLAEANGVPPATVHRWIREAKARGILRLPAHRHDSSSPHT